MTFFADENWRPIPGWEGSYEVSDLGRVRSVARTVHFVDGRVRHYPSRLRASHTDGFGYRKVTLKANGRQVRVLVHQAVAAAWIGPRPPGLEVCHGDGDKANNTAHNLRYDTRAANHVDAVRHGTARRPRKLSEDAVEAIRAARGTATGAELAAKYGTSKTHVCNIQRGKRRTT